jgi:hypothetical protein
MNIVIPYLLNNSTSRMCVRFLCLELILQFHGCCRGVLHDSENFKPSNKVIRISEAECRRAKSQRVGFGVDFLTGVCRCGCAAQRVVGATVGLIFSINYRSIMLFFQLAGACELVRTSCPHPWHRSSESLRSSWSSTCPSSEVRRTSLIEEIRALDRISSTMGKGEWRH